MYEYDSSSSLGLLDKHRFEHRGLLTVIVSTLIAFVLLFSIFFIHVNLTSSVFREKTLITRFPPPGESLNSTWTTSYVLPKNISLLEIHSQSFNFKSACPSEKFALVIHLATDLEKVESWMEKCGSKVLYFRMNSDNLEEHDVDRIVNYVPNAQYIPIKAEYHGVKDSYQLLSNSAFQQMVDKESNIITSLHLSGYVTSSNVRTLVDLVPFVEVLTLEGPELCSSLLRQLRVSQSACSITWNELRKLKINVINDCQRTFEFIDMCWNMPQLKRLEIEGTQLNPVNVRYIEDIIDKYRIMNVNFDHNVCAEEVLQTGAYMCWKFL